MKTLLFPRLRFQSGTYARSADPPGPWTSLRCAQQTLLSLTTTFDVDASETDTLEPGQNISRFCALRRRNACLKISPIKSGREHSSSGIILVGSQIGLQASNKQPSRNTIRHHSWALDVLLPCDSPSNALPSCLPARSGAVDRDPDPDVRFCRSVACPRAREEHQLPGSRADGIRDGLQPVLEAVRAVREQGCVLRRVRRRA